MFSACLSRFFSTCLYGDLLTRLASNMAIRDALTNQILGGLLDGTFVLTLFAALMIASPYLGLLTALIAALQALVPFVTASRTRGLTELELAAAADSQSCVFEMLAGITTLKASGCEDRVYEQWSGRLLRHLNIAVHRGRHIALIDSALLALRSVSPLILLWAAAQYALTGVMSIGAMFVHHGACDGRGNARLPHSQPACRNFRRCGLISSGSSM